MILFGLGNPGIRYRWTRHNAGFIFLDRLARRYKGRFFQFKGYKKAEIEIDEKKIKLIKPALFMNRSGVVVFQVLKEEPDEFMVVLDDINLPLGKLRLRARGSDGGHLGLRSIINELNTENFKRLRIGIGPLTNGKDAIEYVLNNFTKEEKRIVLFVVDKAIAGLEILIKDGFDRAQNYINSISPGNR